MTSASGSRIYVDGLALAFRLHSSGMRVGVSAHEKFNVLPFKVKGLNWLCLAMVLKPLF
jgi:hypothetical protein